MEDRDCSDLEGRQPCRGYIGVPITFLSSYDPEQFRIIGLDRYVRDSPDYGHRFKVGGKEKYARVIIQRIK